MGNFLKKTAVWRRRIALRMQRKIERMPGLAGKKCSMLQGLQAGYTQCFDICCHLLHRLCLLFSLSEFYIRSFAGQRKGCGFAKTS